jgi:hypothetical protein
VRTGELDERVDDLLGELPEVRLELLVAELGEVPADLQIRVLAGNLRPP